MTTMQALVVFSGGQDSTTCLAQVVRRHGAERVACITFHYGQRHSREVEVARRIAEHFNITEHKFINLDWYNQVTESALLDTRATISQTRTASCPNTVVDGRNMAFLLVAAVYAKQRGIRDIIIGVSETDFSGYPDCRKVFLESCNRTLNLSMDYEFNLIAPLMGMTKAQIWALADLMGEFEYIADNTLTCYNGVIGTGCGECPSCRLRQRGLEEYSRGGKC